MHDVPHGQDNGVGYGGAAEMAGAVRVARELAGVGAEPSYKCT